MAPMEISHPPSRHGSGGQTLRIFAWALAGLALLTPWIAMQFTEEVNWSGGDFVVFGLMLLAAGGLFELAVRATGNGAYRAGVGVALLATFLLAWINGAVGIIGNENNPANLMFAGVVAVAFGGALLARGRPAGMAHAMMGAAGAQVLVALVTLALGLGQIFAITAVFVGLWLASAALFRKSTAPLH